MVDCECLSTCPFFNDRMADKPATSELLKKQYCRDNFDQCARYQVFKKLGKSAIPPDLFPNSRDRAEDIINNA